MALLLAATGIDKSYPRHDGPVEVLRGCDLQLDEGEAVAVMGPSGSGKSTLLNIVGGLDWPDRGTVRHRDRVLDLADPRAMSVWRTAGVGFVFQFHFLLPDFTARENLLLPVQARRKVTGADRDRADRLLEAMGLTPRAGHLPGELSGGEQQRVAVARAFMNRPDIVLADEPFGNLDHAKGSQLGDLLFALRRDEGTALVIVTHDPVLAARADRTLVLEAGRLRPA
ncbi:MAG: ABC transporter ATP-binding protein [Candidatus Krumholzibacteriia bacterium]